MSLLKMICRELGVEVGEEWLGSDGKTYVIEKDVILEWSEVDKCEEDDYGSLIVSGYEAYADILQGKLKPVWKPKRTEKYYVPCIDSIKFRPYLYDVHVWGYDEDYDEIMFERGLVYKTREEAIAVANKMLEAIKEGD